MKIKLSILLSLFASACSTENLSYEQILFSRVEFTSNEKQYNKGIEESKRFGLLLNLDSIKSMDSFKTLINENYCDKIFFIQLSEISKVAYLPISYYCNEIIDINIKDVTVIRKIEDVKGSTNKNKSLVIDTHALKVIDLKKIANQIALDYKSTLEEKTGKPIEDLSITERIETVKKVPLTIMII
uniref:Lipoprotein n=1 Tax=Roseihalotalea indica TaxID=2867963 RepID=A0AA49JJ38_9BACT|nr:hypothetical protein K4G66_06200 [Tunicatimonas sp. TK19036]